MQDAPKFCVPRRWPSACSDVSTAHTGTWRNTGKQMVARPCTVQCKLTLDQRRVCSRFDNGHDRVHCPIFLLYADQYTMIQYGRNTSSFTNYKFHSVCVCVCTCVCALCVCVCVCAHVCVCVALLRAPCFVAPNKTSESSLLVCDVRCAVAETFFLLSTSVCKNFLVSSLGTLF